MLGPRAVCRVPLRKNRGEFVGEGLDLIVRVVITMFGHSRSVLPEGRGSTIDPRAVFTR